MFSRESQNAMSRLRTTAVSKGDPLLYHQIDQLDNNLAKDGKEADERERVLRVRVGFEAEGRSKLATENARLLAQLKEKNDAIITLEKSLSVAVEVIKVGTLIQDLLMDRLEE